MSKFSSFLASAGERYNAFVVERVVFISELQCQLREIIHVPTGARVMHIENDDEENLFCLSFKTLPASGNGVAHVLEHTVLCGSHKYPIKDPFFAMHRRSLHTFMNAMTGADFTCYPAASQVEKDFYHLLDVYIDAVFHPQLKKMSFLQEGHRLEFADSEDENSPLIRKGIVYNEMKGSMTSPDARLWHELMRLLVPDLPYAHNSGGDPEQIPTLTYPELIDFHDTYYHPSRCLFFFYGNFPLAKHLDILAEKALKTVLPLAPLPHIPAQQRFSAPVYKTVDYPVSARNLDGRDAIVCFGWLTMPLAEQRNLLGLSILASVLMDNDASFLKAALIQSGLCVSADACLESEMSEVPFAIICRGCKAEDVADLERCLFVHLEEWIREPIAQQAIAAAIHQIELARTEIHGGHHPFGLTLFFRAGLARQQGCLPENSLVIHSLCADLLEAIKDPDYLPGLLCKYLLQNPHRVCLLLRADPELSTREEEAEKRWLEVLRGQLRPEEMKEILLMSKDLALYQKSMEGQAVDCLPKMTIEEVPRHAKEFLLGIHVGHNVDVFYHDCFTNHILYADLIWDLGRIAQRDLSCAQLLASLVTEVGVGERAYWENLEYIQAYTGGVHCSYHLFASAREDAVLDPAVRLGGKALCRHAAQLIRLLCDTAHVARCTEQGRIKDLIAQVATGLQTRLSRNASRYAIQTALAAFSPAHYVSNAWHGLGYYQAIHSITARMEQDPGEVINELQRMYTELFCMERPHLVLSCDSTSRGQIDCEDFFSQRFSTSSLPAMWESDYILPCSQSQIKIFSSPVAFNCAAFRVPRYTHPDAPALHLATALFENIVLHPVVREQGGAYGAGATYNPMMGHLYFHSYRDPYICTTWEAFIEAIHTIAAEQFRAEDLDEARLGLIQQFDLPISPGSRAITAYTWMREQKTAALRQHYRDRLLCLRTADVAKAVYEHLTLQMDAGVFVSYAGQQLVEQQMVSEKYRGLPVTTLTENLY